MKATIVTKRYIACPCCGRGEFQIQHLLSLGRPTEFGPWFCDYEDCCTELQGRIDADGSVEIEHRKTALHGIALLKLGGLYLVVDEPASRMDDEHADYFYHSHQCPLNLLLRVSDVFDATGRDPHGVMRFVANIDATPRARERLEQIQSLAELFHLFGTDGQPQHSEWPEENGGMLPQVAALRRRGAGEA